MRRFLILIGPRDCPRECPRIRLDVMATDSVAAVNQHMDLVRFGERMDVRAV